MPYADPIMNHALQYAAKYRMPMHRLLTDRTKDVCRIRNRVIATAVAKGFTETEVARALNRDQTTIRNSLRRYEEAQCKA